MICFTVDPPSSVITFSPLGYCSAASASAYTLLPCAFVVLISTPVLKVHKPAKSSCKGHHFICLRLQMFINLICFFFHNIVQFFIYLFIYFIFFPSLYGHPHTYYLSILSMISDLAYEDFAEAKKSTSFCTSLFFLHYHTWYASCIECFIATVLPPRS